MANVTKTPATPPPKVEMPAYLTEDAAFTGSWRGDELIVQGRIEGELNITGWVRIGRSGRVEGNVKARSVEVNGGFKGDIKAQLIVFGETARAQGTFASERLVVKEGSVVDGAFEQTPPAPPPAEPVKGGAAPVKATAPGQTAPAPAGGLRVAGPGTAALSQDANKDGEKKA